MTCRPRFWAAPGVRSRATCLTTAASARPSMPGSRTRRFDVAWPHFLPWATGGVRTCRVVFSYISNSGEAGALVRTDIARTDTSGVTTMNEMFGHVATAFDQDISGWTVDKVTERMFGEPRPLTGTSAGAWDGRQCHTPCACAVRMFRDASSFDQDLAWCVGDGVSLDDVFNSAWALRRRARCIVHTSLTRHLP